MFLMSFCFSKCDVKGMSGKEMELVDEIGKENIN